MFVMFLYIYVNIADGEYELNKNILLFYTFFLYIGFCINIYVKDLHAQHYNILFNKFSKE